MPYYSVRDNTFVASSQPPQEAQRLAQLSKSLLPPLVTELHRSLHSWGTLGKRPGLLTPERVWATPEGTLHIYFEEGQTPYPLLHIGMAPDLATWFVLLDKWMETHVVVARARTVWTPVELASAMTFINPLWLPASLVALPPNNWEGLLRALAVAVADGPLPDTQST